jgi:hypothetical protein
MRCIPCIRNDRVRSSPRPEIQIHLRPLEEDMRVIQVRDRSRQSRSIFLAVTARLGPCPDVNWDRTYFSERWARDFGLGGSKR